MFCPLKVVLWCSFDSACVVELLKKTSPFCQNLLLNAQLTVYMCFVGLKAVGVLLKSASLMPHWWRMCVVEYSMWGRRLIVMLHAMWPVTDRCPKWIVCFVQRRDRCRTAVVHPPDLGIGCPACLCHLLFLWQQAEAEERNGAVALLQRVRPNRQFRLSVLKEGLGRVFST